MGRKTVYRSENSALSHLSNRFTYLTLSYEVKSQKKTYRTWQMELGSHLVVKVPAVQA